jgi:hypothetical protein
MDRLEIIETLKHIPRQVEAETEGLSDSVLRYRPADGEWSINEIVGHLRDMAEVWSRRMYMTWSLTDPLFPSFDGEASVREHNYQEADLKTLIREMHEHRMHTVETLAHAVDWSRLGQHPGFGRRSLKQLGEYIIEHDSSHLADIRKLKSEQSTKLPA